MRLCGTPPNQGRLLVLSVGFEKALGGYILVLEGVHAPRLLENDGNTRDSGRTGPTLRAWSSTHVAGSPLGLEALRQRLWTEAGSGAFWVSLVWPWISFSKITGSILPTSGTISSASAAFSAKLQGHNAGRR